MHNYQRFPIHDPETGNVLGHVKPDMRGRIIIDPDIEDKGLDERLKINSAEGAQREKDEEALREERKQKSSRAEHHTNDEIVEAQENLADFRKSKRYVQFVWLPTGAGFLVLSALTAWTWWFLAPLILGGIVMIATGAQLLTWHTDRTEYNLRKAHRKAQSAHRDVVERPETWYDKKGYDEL